MAERAAMESTTAPTGHPSLLLFGVFAAPAAWVLQLVASYAIAASSCFPNGVATPGTASISRMPLAIIALACMLTALAGLVVALQQHRAAGGDAATRQPARSRALARVGILSSILFLGAIGFSIVMLSLSPQCAG